MTSICHAWSSLPVSAGRNHDFFPCCLKKMDPVLCICTSRSKTEVVHLEYKMERFMMIFIFCWAFFPQSGTSCQEGNVLDKLHKQTFPSLWTALLCLTSGVVICDLSPGILRQSFGLKPLSDLKIRPKALNWIWYVQRVMWLWKGTLCYLTFPQMGSYLGQWI